MPKEINPLSDAIANILVEEITQTIFDGMLEDGPLYSKAGKIAQDIVNRILPVHCIERP